MLDTKDFRIESGHKVNLDKRSTSSTAGYQTKEDVEDRLKVNIEEMVELQNILYAEDRRALLIIFQAMDGAGKDSSIKHVMSGLNPQGTMVHSFKKPSPEELDHDYLWRYIKCLPERGQIGIFNRSYYEDVLVVRVHNLLKEQKMPGDLITKDIWNERFQQIRSFEEYLSKNGVVIIKFYLHISRDEQKVRLLERIDDRSKNWKFAADDLRERQYWKDYIQCYEEAIEETSTHHAPWYVVPSDQKWFSRLAVSNIIIDTLKTMKLEYPELDQEQLKILQACRESLLAD